MTCQEFRDLHDRPPFRWSTSETVQAFRHEESCPECHRWCVGRPPHPELIALSLEDRERLQKEHADKVLSDPEAWS